MNESSNSMALKEKLTFFLKVDGDCSHKKFYLTCSHFFYYGLQTQSTFRKKNLEYICSKF